MPEINPLSNEQIFLKKIAENTGSNYDTGDVSEINPLTIDQILLKEIAANTAGQSGDITELENKVAANAEAIEAIVNVNGACNALPIDLASSDIIDGVTFTVTFDGIVVSGTATADIDYPLHSNSPVLNKNVNYKLTGCPAGGSSDTYYLQVGLWNSSTFIDGYRDYGNGNSFNSENNTGISGDIIIKSGTAITTPITFKPMLYDARLNPTGYVPYAMTNRELTERVEKIKTLEFDFSNVPDTNTPVEIIVPNFGNCVVLGVLARNQYGNMFFDTQGTLFLFNGLTFVGNDAVISVLAANSQYCGGVAKAFVTICQV